MVVIKRNCDEATFDKQKIYEAIIKAMPTGNGVKKEIAQKIADEIETEVLTKEEITVGEIEAKVFDKLIKYKQRNTARSYESFRAIREFQRECDNSTDSELDELLSGESEYWARENSNKNPKVANVQRDYMAGIVSTDITRRKLLSPSIVQAHDEGILHFHDADYFGMDAIHNCCLINLEDMLQNGTVINDVSIDSPKSFSTACNIATQAITGVASSQYGGCTITLTHLAPFVRVSKGRIEKEERENHPIVSKLFKKRFNAIVDKKLRKEINKGVEIFNYQVNSMSTTNGQAPFITVFMYLGETDEYKEELAMVIEEFLNQRLIGLKNEVGVYVTQAFPKLIYVLEEDNITKGSPYWYLTELSAKCTAKRLVPDYISEKKMKELKDGYCYPSMGCRSFLAPSCGDKFYGRFNEGVVTLNLPDVAFSSDGDVDKFWELMEQRTELCHKALKARHERLWNTSSDVAPILWQNGALARLPKHEPINSLLNAKYCSISLGYAGLYECVKFMTKHSHTDGNIGHDFGIKVMQFLNDKCNQWKAEENLGYSLYGSPIESTTYKFAKCLKKRFGDDIFVKLDGEDRNYITNSYHVPVFEEINPFDKLSIESEFQAYSLGGAISYVECADLTKNTNAVLAVMRFIYDNIMYAELNTKSDYCQVCGYDGEIKIIDEGGKLVWECPNCGNRDQDKMNVSRRTCGRLILPQV